MTEWFNKLSASFAFLIEHPVILVCAIAFVGFAAWVQGRLYRRIFRNQAKATFAGWEADAGSAVRRHETGVGQSEVKVMKPPRRNIWVAFWTLLFFGGGAVFFWLVVLPEPAEQTFKNWMVFAISCVFAALGLMILVMSFTRIEVSSDKIVLRRLFRRQKQFLLNSIVSVTAAGKNPALGVKLTFSDERSLKLMAAYIGYSDVLTQIQGAHPDIAKFLIMGRLTHNWAKGKSL